jgi:flavin reductase (DIM6/NTAB) family NADH-FMN oxidoreductase RutF
MQVPALMRRLEARARRLAVRAGLDGGPSAFTRVAYLQAREVVLISASAGGKDALWPVDWHMPVALEPPHYAFSCRRGAHGCETVRQAGVFVINFMGVEHEPAILEAGRSSGATANKFATLGLDATPATFVAAPRVLAAAGWIEAELVEHHELGDRTLFVGRVVHAESAPTGKRLFHEWRRP